METIIINKEDAIMLFEHAICGINTSLAYNKFDKQFPISVKLLKERKNKFQELRKELNCEMKKVRKWDL